jgi:DNA-binding response OmpR family regulator
MTPAAGFASSVAEGERTMSGSERVLIVEDEPNVRLVFRTALESPGYEIATSEDGEAAMKALRTFPADVVLLDLQMPNLDGMGFLKRLRAEGNNVPVVIVTAHGNVPDAVAAMRLGAFDFLAKPLTPDALRNVVTDVLGRASRPPEPARARAAPAPAEGAAAGLLAEAKQALHERKFDHAEHLLSQAAGRDPRGAEARYLLGVLHEMRGKGDAAYAAYRTALKADPGFEPALLHLMKYFSDRMM